ncbi:MAG: ATP-dependent helicase [Halobacteriaceae archaeon]
MGRPLEAAVPAGVRERVPNEDAVTDWDVLGRLSEPVQSWWVDEFGAYVEQNDGLFTPPQAEAIPLIDDGETVLVAAPTGSGKTLAAFTAILDDLHRRAGDGGLANAVHCLYISPLKSLANDIHRNLERPLDGILDRADGDREPIRHAIRHGDTPDSERQAMLAETPHILNTTPETLAILLNSPQFREKLRAVKYVIVDEIHALADNKRGTHLTVSLERLERLADGSPTRIGCSATVEPLTTVADFLAGVAEPGSSGEPPTIRDREIVDARFARDYDLELRCPVPDLVHAAHDQVRNAFYAELATQVADHETTIVFTNTRSGAERVLQALEDRDSVASNRAACHHGSLSTARRQAVEERLKHGELDVVTTSTSLELGIDMPTVDLVVQVGSPKSTAALLQRVGRAGHRVGETVEGRVFALDRDELVECAVMLDCIDRGFIDRVFVPERAHDVAAQHVYGMAINRVWAESALVETLRSAYPYREYSDRSVEALFRYLTAEYDGLEDRRYYAKIWRDRNDPPEGEHHYPEFAVGERLVGKRGRLARPIYMQNVGTIPDSFSCDVVLRESADWVGSLDENYLDTLEPGDVFVLGGERFAYRYRRGSKVYVDRTDARPTVPSWFSERLPLSYDLGVEIADFQGRLLERYERGGKALVRAWLRDLPIDDDAVRAIASLFDEQLAYTGVEGVATADRLVIEQERDRAEYERRYYVHSTYGRQFNDGLSRILASRCAQTANANVSVAVADNGFVLSMPLNRKVDLAGILRSLRPDDVGELLRESLDGTDLLQRYFRINATRSLLVLKRYKGTERSASEQQVRTEMLLGFAEGLRDFAPLEETYRELLEDRLDRPHLEAVVEAIQDGSIEVTEVTVDSPSPRAFGLATLMASDVVLAEDEDAVLQEFHARVMEAIEADEEADRPGRADSTDL